MSTQIVVNSILEWIPGSKGEKPSLERVLWVDNAGEHCVLIPLFEKDPLPVLKSVAELVLAMSEEIAFRRPVDPFAHLVNPEPTFVEKHRSRMDRAWGIIQSLAKAEPEIYLTAHRGKLIRAACEEFQVAPKEIYKYLKRYWVGGKTQLALLPFFHQCGGPGKERRILEADPNLPKRGRPTKILFVNPEHIGVNVDEETKKLFRIAIKLYYDNRDRNPLKKAYDQMIDNHFNVGYRKIGEDSAPIIPPASELPTFEQFRYWNRKERRLVQSIIAREGKRQYNLKSRPILGNSTQMAIGPGSIFQVDATIGDVYLVSTLNRNWIIGRPVIYFVVDVFSRMIVGLYIGLEGPSWISGMMAIASATTDKVAFCAEYGIEISPEAWPCRYLPESILADRGEFIGINSDRLPGSLDVPLANCPPYRADWKAIVEQMFRRANLTTIHWLPGAVRGREPGETDHRLDATLDLRQFTKIIILTVLEYNLYHRIEGYPMDQDMIRDDVQPIPIELWEWGIANRSGHLRERSPEAIKLNLMPADSATITPKGIRFKGLHYSTDRALREGWYVKARREGTWSIPVSYDPRCLNTLYLRNGEDSVFDVCHLVQGDERFQGQMLEEIMDYFEIQNIRSKQHRGTRMQSGAELRSRIQAIESEAQQMKEEAISEHSKTKQIQGIRKNRAFEKEKNREAEAFDLAAERNDQETRNPLPLSEKELPVTGAIRKDRLLSLLKNRNQEEDGEDPKGGRP